MRIINNVILWNKRRRIEKYMQQAHDLEELSRYLEKESSECLNQSAKLLLDATALLESLHNIEWCEACNSYEHLPGCQRTETTNK